MRPDLVRKAAVLFTVVLGLTLLIARPTWARPSATIDVGFFYDDLAPYGSWVEVRPYGWVWAPRVADEWRPYERGRWVWTDDYGWLWESDEEFGWATYHYGRWYRDPDYRWAWVPGYDWAPAWVSWRHGGGYVGWAPLSPRVVWTSGVGFRIGSARLDAFIEPDAYTFCRESAFFDRAVARNVLPSTRNRELITLTRNVTDYRAVDRRIVDRGIRVDRMEAAVGRRAPRPRLLEVDSAREARAARSLDAVAVFRPSVRPRAGAAPPRARIERGEQERLRREVRERAEARERQEKPDEDRPRAAPEKRTEHKERAVQERPRGKGPSKGDKGKDKRDN